MYFSDLSLSHRFPQLSLFLPLSVTVQHMQATFGQRLATARRTAGYRTQAALGSAVGVGARTIRNWESDRTAPDVGKLAALRLLIGNFDDGVDEDPVEAAVRRSRLHHWRQSEVVALYQRHLYEQGREVG